MREHIKIESSNATHLEVKVYYSLGGMNYFTYKTEERGYYVSVTPVTISENMISFTCFSGLKSLLVPCTRKSDKSYKAALAKLTPEFKQQLIDKVLGHDSVKSNLAAIAKELGISLPARFEGMTKEEIESLPVHIVGGNAGEHFASLEEAKRAYDLSKLCGPFGCEARDHLRFETQEAYKVLSA